MFFLFVKRVVKHNTGATAKYQPRTSNNESWTFSGPFSKRSLAERAAVGALATHTCLAVVVAADSDLDRLIRESDSESRDYARGRVLREVQRLFLKAEAIG